MSIVFSVRVLYSGFCVVNEGKIFFIKWMNVLCNDELIFIIIVLVMC